MWPTVFLGLLIASLAGWAFTWWRQRLRIRQLERSKEEIQIEETLVFDFLHGLGEAFTETIRAADLHRLIVEGAARVLDAQGGALYMMERAGGKLAPAFISKGCPPFIDVPTHILQQAASNPAALESYLRLHAIAPGEGIIGRVWQMCEPVLLTDLANAPELAGLRGTSLGAASVMVTPLLYGKQNMSVLATGTPPQPAWLQTVNRQLYPDIKEDMSISMAYAILDHAQDTVTLCRAGHDAPILFNSETKTAVPVKPPGMVVGIDSGSVFDRITGDFPLSLKRNDCLLFYTDGVTEALDANGDEFGPERMIECVRTSAPEGAPAIITRIIDELRDFVGAQPQNDDITLIAIRKT